MYEQPSAPQSIGGVLDSGFKLFKVSFKQVVVLAFAGALLTSVPSAYMSRQMQSVIPDPTQATEQMLQMFSPTFFLLIALSTIASMVFLAAILITIDAVANDRECSIGQALGQGLRRLPAVFIGGLLYSLLMGVGLLLLVVPGIILAVSLYGTMYLIANDKMGPIAALKRSHTLVWGDWWRTSAILTVTVIIAMVVFMLVGVVASIFAFGGDETTPIAASPLWFDMLLVPLLSAAIYPLLYAIPYVMLEDLKLRRGGDDLMQRIESSDSA